MNINLEQYAWDDFFAEAKKSSLHPQLQHGRVVSVHKSKYEVVTSDGVFSCDILGNLQFQKNPLLKPAVGDWVLLDFRSDVFVIVEILKRKTLLKRQKKHDRFPKPLAANVDKAVIVQAVGLDFHIKRLERILTHVYEAGVTPLVVIHKVDQASGEERARIQSELNKIPTDIPLFFTSIQMGEGIEDFEKALQARETIVFMGSSGVGKSSLINHLIGKPLLKTQEVMERTGKGKHTTTARRLLKLPSGVLLIDTPGTREFGMHFDDQEALKQSFARIEELAAQCRFSDCGHTNEPGCAVREAIQQGSIQEEIFERYLHLQNESKKTAKQMRQGEKRSSKKRATKQPPRSVRRGK